MSSSVFGCPVLSLPPAAARRISVGSLLARPAGYPSPPAPILRARAAAKWESSGRLCPCCTGVNTRRLFLGASSVMLPVLSAAAASPGGPPSDPLETLERVHPGRMDWYEKLYAKLMSHCTKGYEAEVAVYKEKLFSELADKSKNVLELGVGTGPNFKYYVSGGDQYVIGVDPNKQMEKYARASAEAAGLQSTNFRFIRGVGESIDVMENSMDVVIGTIVLCSVSDVAGTLREIKRVLKPGGLYLFIEHVAAPDGSLRRFVQGLLNPLQQFVADGCHLTRDTGKLIAEAGFSNVSQQTAELSSVSIIGTHVYGIACK